jgi:hypothetical protein
LVPPDTKIQHPVGLTGIRKKDDTPDVLIPGLKMSFGGEAGGQESQVVANKITFDSDDLALVEAPIGRGIKALNPGGAGAKPLRHNLLPLRKRASSDNA